VVLFKYATVMINPAITPAPSPGRAFTERGPILDRKGRILALQTRLGNITLWRPDMEDPEALAKELAPILEIPAAEIQDRILSTPSDFMYLKKQVEQSTLRIIEAAKAAGTLPGINIEPIVGRIYPEQELAGQIIGFVGDDNRGLAGIEYAFDRVLTRSASEGGGTEQRGSQVVLTLDIMVQHILEKIARQTMIENQAEAVMFMALDPRTGDILGSASLPGFNPNEINSSDEISRMDRPSIWAYEPGSVFKVFSLAALLDAELIGEQTVFVCNGHYERTTSRGKKIVINCLSAHGRVTARDIIVYSCNAGAAYASDHMGKDAFYGRLRDFGFGSRTGTGIPGETAGFLRAAEGWSDRSKPTIAMGQEIAVSAMQMLQAATAVANDGILVPPRIVSRILSGDGSESAAYEGSGSRRVLRSETARTMRRYMTDVTSNIGTGWRANIEDLSLAVKTGTAQIIDPETGAYSERDFIASCIALVPAESPALILYLAIIKPQGASYLGGRIAAPAIREAVESLVDYLGIPRGKNPQVIHPGLVKIPQEEGLSLSGQVPDFSGYSKRSLLPLLLQDEVHIEITGDGWVRWQNPPPGSPLSPGDTIFLELE
jgi:cell division protein FtsI (penicillin-binding protein 3)